MGEKTIDNRYKAGIYSIYTFFILLIHIPMGYMSDDAVVAPTIVEYSLLDCVQQKYLTNGRYITDVIANAFYRMPLIVWKIFDVGIYLLISFLLVYLFTDKKFKDVIVVCVLLMLFPFSYLMSAGYIATSTNYVYPVTCLLLILVPLHNLNCGKKVHFIWHFISAAAVIYATNQEQSGILLIGGLLFYIVYLLKNNDRKGIKRYVLILFVFSLMCYCFMFFSPGHLYRIHSTEEMERWLPQYADWTFWGKVYHGYSSTVANLLYHNVDLFFVFSSLLFAAAILRRQNNAIKYSLQLACGSIPVIVVELVKMLGEKYFVVFYDYACRMPELIAWEENPLPMVISVITVISIFTTVTLVFEGKERLLIIALLTLAAGSRWMIGFSPTIYASSYRTFIYFIYILIVCCLFIYREIKKYVCTD